MCWGFVVEVADADGGFWFGVVGLFGGFPFVSYGDGVFPDDGDEWGWFLLGLGCVYSVVLGLFVSYVVSDDLVWGCVWCVCGFGCFSYS